MDSAAAYPLSQQIGGATGSLVARLLQEQRHPEHGYRACLGLLSLSRCYGRDRLEAACALALELGMHLYRHVRVLHGNGGFTKWLLQVAHVDVLLLDLCAARGYVERSCSKANPPGLSMP